MKVALLVRSQRQVIVLILISFFRRSLLFQPISVTFSFLFLCYLLISFLCLCYLLRVLKNQKNLPSPRTALRLVRSTKLSVPPISRVRESGLQVRAEFSLGQWLVIDSVLSGILKGSNEA